MKPILRKLEVFFDRMITPALLALVVIVVADIFFTDLKYEYEMYFLYLDIFVISIFVGDLSFKFKRAANWKGFLRREWLEILAIIPFFWIFRLIESIVRVGELLQEFIHLIARGGRLVRFLAVFNLTASRHERFKKLLDKLNKNKRFEEAAEFFKPPPSSEKHDD